MTKPLSANYQRLSFHFFAYICFLIYFNHNKRISVLLNERNNKGSYL